jgi:NitT/TauT family transport system substrate-binding protein
MEEEFVSKFKKWSGTIGLTTIGLLACAYAAQAQQPLKFNYGAPSGDYYVLYTARDAGLFEKNGLEPTFFMFQSGAPLLAGLKSESLDVITTGLATAFALGQKITLKLLFWEMDDAAGEGLVVGAKTGITSYRDIKKAKAIGAPSGTCAQVSLGLIAKAVGIKVTDLNVINIAPPLYANAFASGSIDAGVAWAPYAQALAERGQIIVNYDADYGIDNGICPVMTGGRSKFLEQRPEIGLKLLQIHHQALEMIEKNPQLAIDAMVKYLSVTPSVAKAAYDRLCCARKPTARQQLEPNSPYSLVSKESGLNKKLQIATQMLADAGSIREPLTADEIADAIDPSYLRQFVERQTK